MATTRAAENATDIDDATVDAMIELDPHRPGRHNARFVEYGHHVWAIIAYLQGTNWDIAKTAAAYNMPENAVRAAIRYYEKHRELIDAYLLLEHEEFISG